MTALKQEIRGLKLIPAGYGAFGLLDGVLTGLFYVAAYCLLRIAGVGRALAAAAMGVAVIALVFNLPYSGGGLPQQGEPRRRGEAGHDTHRGASRR